MDKKVILAVAGSGKTAHIIDKLDATKRSIILTYTNNNYRNLEKRIISKFGYFPENIALYTYFTFVYSQCFKPYLSQEIKTKGIFWVEGSLPLYLKSDDISYYQDQGSTRLYNNRIAKLLKEKGVYGYINERIEKYFDNLFVDEVQDFGGHDFNLLKNIASAEVSVTLVGDYYQHTFDTSRDRNVNGRIYESYDRYLHELSNAGLEIDTEALINSYRCSPTVCDFISNNMGIHIDSHREDGTIIKVIDNVRDAEIIYKDDSIIKLFYQAHYKHSCSSRNWGDSKGENDYNDVCVVLNPSTLKKFNDGELEELLPQTKNKLYVACTRTRGDLYFLPQNLCPK